MSRATLWRLEKIEAAIKPTGRILAASTPDEAELIKFDPADFIVITGVPRGLIEQEWPPA